MRRKIATALALLLLALALPGSGRAQPVTAEQQKVLDYLLANWGIDTNVTGVDLAMQIVGGTYTADDRYALAVYLREHPELHRVRRAFGWETVALTPDEKLIARQLSWAERDERPAPGLGELTSAVEVSAERVREGLKMLERLGIIRRAAAAGGVGYRMANDGYVDWEGAGSITFMFHRVRVEGVKTLDTYWAIDFIALVNAKWRDKKVTVEDSSQYSGKRIHVVFENGRVSELDPATTRVFRGGGWGIDNLFSSEEEVSRWLESRPELKGRPVFGVQEYVDRLFNPALRRWAAISWSVLALLALLLTTSAAKRKRTGPVWFWKATFFGGVLTLAVYVALVVKAYAPGIGISIPPYVFFAFPALAIATGTLGFRAFASFWRYLALLFAIAGLLLILLAVLTGGPK